MKHLFLLAMLSISQVYAQTWEETQKVTSSDGAQGDIFGVSIYADGNYMIVGALSEKEDASGTNTLTEAGSAYIYEKDLDGNWNEVQKIVASDRAAGDKFGNSVSIYGDYIIVGASLEREDASGGNTLNYAGSAYIYEKDVDGNWNEVQKIVASDRALFDHFGTSVAIFNDYAIIGAYFEDEDATGNNTLADSGSIYVFERDAEGVWNEVQKIVASDRESGAYFGYSVSVNGDYLIAGAYREDKDVAGGNSLSNAGAAYIFKRDAGGVWNEVQKLVASDRGVEDNFGFVVAIEEDFAIVSAYREDEDISGGNTLNEAGAAYIFEKDVTGTWNEVRKLVASDRNANDEFGFSVSIGENYAIVGAQNEDDDASGGNAMIQAGSAYIFERNASGIWNQMQKIVASDRFGSTFFGSSCFIAENYAVIGARLAGVDGISQVGAVYSFQLSPPLSVLKNDSNPLFKVYPNPSNGKFMLDFDTSYDNIKIEITNIMGQKTFSKHYQNTDFIDVEIKGKSGIYFVNVTTTAGNKKTLKVLKK